MVYYRDKVTLDPSNLSVREFYNLVDEVRGVSTDVQVNPEVASIVFEVEAEDLWDLRELLSELENGFNGYGSEFIPSKDKIELP